MRQLVASFSYSASDMAKIPTPAAASAAGGRTAVWSGHFQTFYPTVGTFIAGRSADFLCVYIAPIMICLSMLSTEVMIKEGVCCN